MRDSSTRLRRLAEVSWIGAIVLATAGVAIALNPIPSTLVDFHQPGTQPNSLTDPLASARFTCANCHAAYDEQAAPYDRWVHSMMGQAARDPIFKACLAIANQDSPFAGDICLRCHMPQGWLRGHSTPPDGSSMTDIDFEGVACSICHRMVNPNQDPMGPTDPAPDATILQDLDAAGNLPVNPHSGSYVIDPFDRRRGPLNLDADWMAIGYPDGFPFHQWLQSPFHLTSQLCATCHDVSNPLYARQPDDTYVLTAENQPNPSANKYDQFPIERTFSEWSVSAFAQGPIDVGGRFGGDRPAVSTCQDCHMPAITGQACALEPPIRHDLPQHNFNGANSWVLGAINASYFQSETGMNDLGVDSAIKRNKDMLRAASDLNVFVDGSTLTARVINYTGHKLPTGYGEGRRMWVNVRFLDQSGQVIAEDGAYDDATAVLDETTTKVYEMVQGVDSAVAGAANIPEGPSMHFALNNKIYKDNRIPPMGFDNASFAAVQAAPVAYAYADGQYWDDTDYAIPSGTFTAVVKVFHQTTTKEYIEFLRDENVNSVGDPNNPSVGEIAYNLWDSMGRSAPVEMDSVTVNVACPCDLDADGTTDVFDLLNYLSAWFASDTAADQNGDSTVDVFDLLDYLQCWFNCTG